MSFWDDVKSTFDFEKFQIEDVWEQIKEDPERVFIGAMEPFSSKLWSGITGKDYEPLMNQWGGPTEERFGRARDAGIDTGPSEGGHEIAQSIAQSYALGYGGEQAGAFAEGQGASPEVGSGIEQGIKQIGGAAIDPPPPSYDDPDLESQDLLRKKELKASFGMEAPANLGTAQGVDVPGAVRIVHDPHGQVVPPDPNVVPTFGRV